MIQISPPPVRFFTMRKVTLILFKTLSTLSFRKIITLLRITVPHPLLSLLGFYATIQSFAIAHKNFPETSSANGVGNAFRHALWTCLIMMYCCKISSPKKSLKFCKRITDMHEELFPNKPLETKMDLHNNQVGMDLFMEMLEGIHRQFFETGFFVEKLKKMTRDATLLTDLEQEPGPVLVYLEK